MPLIYQNDHFVFHQRHNPKNQGWCVLRVYLHQNKIIAVVSEKLTPTKDYDDGPNDEYLYSLTNGIEVAATFIRTRQHIMFDQLIHYTPNRHRPNNTYPDPINDEDVAMIHLQWNPHDEQYHEQSGIHPWEHITRAEAESLIGQSLDDFLESVSEGNIYKGIRTLGSHDTFAPNQVRQTNAVIFANGHPLPFPSHTASKQSSHEWGIPGPDAFQTALAILIFEFQNYGLEGAEEFATQIHDEFYKQLVVRLPRTEATTPMHLEEWTLSSEQIRAWIARTFPDLTLLD